MTAEKCIFQQKLDQYSIRRNWPKYEYFLFSTVQISANI